MNATPRVLTAHTPLSDSQLWYPLPPRWIPLLRIAASLALLCALYNLVLDRPWSLTSLLHYGSPALLALFCLCVRPERRPPTFFNRLGRLAHLLLIFLILPLAVLAIILRWLHA